MMIRPPLPHLLRCTTATLRDRGRGCGGGGEGPGLPLSPTAASLPPSIVETSPSGPAATGTGAVAAGAGGRAWLSWLSPPGTSGLTGPRTTIA